MKINDTAFNWKGSLAQRKTTGFIVLHHRAGNGDVKSLHNGHLANGWSGIGYHFYVRKDGSIYRGRPIGTVGAHCIGYNDKSVAVCFEGNIEKEKMTQAQINSGRELVSYLKGLYPKAQIKRHKELDSTLCPGKYFEFEQITKGESDMTVDDAVEIIQAKAGLEDGTMEFLLCYKYGEELVVKLAEAMM